MTGFEVDAGRGFAGDLGDPEVDGEARGLHPPTVHGQSTAGNDADGVGKCCGDDDAGKTLDVMRFLHRFGAEKNGAVAGTLQREAGSAKSAGFEIRRVAGEAEERSVGALHANIKNQGKFFEVGDGFGGNEIHIPVREILVLKNSANVGILTAHDEPGRNLRHPIRALFPDDNFSVNDVEAAPPERAQGRVAALLMEVARVAKLDAIETTHGDRDLVEVAENGSAIEKMVGNDGQSEAILFGRRSVGQGSNEDTDLAFPVETLCAGMIAANQDKEKQKNGSALRGIETAKWRQKSHDAFSLQKVDHYAGGNARRYCANSHTNRGGPKRKGRRNG
jgi:hypothetical protein